MKESIIWLFLWCKRLIQKPLLLFTIFLIPLTVLFLQHCHTKQDAVLRVALYTETENSQKKDFNRENSSSFDLVKRMTDLSDSSIYFYVCKSKEQLIDDVKTKKANCGYLIPWDLEDNILSYVKNRKPFLTVIREKNDSTTKIVDEIILSKNYQTIAYDILQEFLETHTNVQPNHDKLTKTFQSYCSNELLFQFEYVSGEKNTVLQNNNTSILMLPLRGIVAVILLLTCMAGGLLCFRDRLQGKYHLMNQKQKKLSTLYSLSIPGIAASFSALFSIKLAGIFGSPFREIPAMLCYLFACLELVALLEKIFIKESIYLASMPVILLSSLVLPPIFIDLGSILPSVEKLAYLFPTTWYLNSIQSFHGLTILFFYGMVCLLLNKLLSHFSLLE